MPLPRCCNAAAAAAAAIAATATTPPARSRVVSSSAPVGVRSLLLLRRRPPRRPSPPPPPPPPPPSPVGRATAATATRPPPPPPPRRTCVITLPNVGRRGLAFADTTTTTTTAASAAGNEGTAARRRADPTFRSYSSSGGGGPPPPRPAVRAADPSASSFYGVLLVRGLMAAGMVYGCTEYGYDITLCEGPSMAPTIRPYGEVVLIDKWSLRRYGVKDGCIGDVRARIARQRQAEYVSALQQRTKPKGPKKRNADDDQKNDEYDEYDDDEDVWHEPYLSVSDRAARSVSWREMASQVLSPLSVGDVVVLQHPHRRGTVCKRVLGLPGDAVLPSGRGGMVVVPDGCVWVEGDNPSNSADSRQYGAVPAALVVGRVAARLWPPRGQAFLLRGGRPANPGPAYYYDNGGGRRRGRGSSSSSAGSIVLPAGYEGQRIVKFHSTTAATQRR